MRALFLLAFALLVTPALAQGWERYDNARFGYSIAVPPGFEAQGEADNGDGQRFTSPKRPTEISVWGGYLMDGFSSEAAASMGFDTDAGWAITGKATTPRWANWSGSDGGRILFQRMIALCDGASYAALRVEYSQADRPDMDPLLERLAASLQGAGC